jgi:formylglycine-generating enzyme required for sulfatase activity
VVLGGAAFNHPRQPVGASWSDAVAYCDWLSGGWADASVADRGGGKGALGGAAGAKYPWGDEPFKVPDGSGDGRFKQDATWQVGAAPPNGYGLVDIAFNIHEWCSDWYAAGCLPFAGARPRPSTGERRASRGSMSRQKVAHAPPGSIRPVPVQRLRFGSCLVGDGDVGPG